MSISNNTTQLQNVLEIVNTLPEAKSEPILQDKIVTPVTNQQNITADEGYDGLGSVTVEGDENLVADNIKNGVSIFGVSGTLEEIEVEDALITKTISVYESGRVTSIGYGAFYSCSFLTSVNFPICTSIGSSAFENCTSLASISFPKCTNIGDRAFHYCHRLISVSFPACTTISGNAFGYCLSLASANFPKCTSIGNLAFSNCLYLKSLYLTGSSLCNLSASGAFTSTPIGGYSASAGYYGSIYVPASLLASYQTATNWTYFSSRFVAYDAGTDGGNSGEIIEFTIAETSYQAEDGMTWAEWCESEYNTDGYYLDSLGYVYNGEEYVWRDNHNRAVAEMDSDVIISGHNYLLMSFASEF